MTDNNDGDESSRGPEYKPGAEIYRDDYFLIQEQQSDDPSEVLVSTGFPPEEGSPTIVDADAMADALNEYLDSIEE